MSQFNIFSELDHCVETDARPSLPSIDTMGSLPALLRSYEKILGWTFRFVPHASESGKRLENGQESGKNSAPSEKLLSDFLPQPELKTTSNPNNTNASVPVEIQLSHGKSHEIGVIEYRSAGSVWNSLGALARQSASAIADMLGEALSTRYQLWRRESELASKSALSVSLHPLEDRQLASALQEILHRASDDLSCVAAAMYLLDDKTSVLKTRSCWGLPTERLLDPARSLKKSSADLEAMLKRTVVMENEDEMRRWNAPEDFASAICVPIASQSNILGTLWFYSQKERRFSSRLIRLAELTADRLAAELERDALLDVYFDQASFKKEIETAALIQKNQLPISAPWIEKWDMAGKVKQKRDFGGNFYDWFTLPDGQIVCALADCQDQGTTAALTAAMVKSSLRSHAQYQNNVNDLMAQVDRTIWASSAADQYVNLFCAILDSKSDRVHISTSGKIKVYRVSQTSAQPISQPTPALGQAPETEFATNSVELNNDDALVVLSCNFERSDDELNAILHNVQTNLNRSARHCVRETFRWLESQNVIPTTDDYSILIIKRKG